MAELNHTDMLMAEALKRARPRRESIGSAERTATAAWENCVIEIAKALGTDRRELIPGRFPRQKFIEACGINGSLVD